MTTVYRDQIGDETGRRIVREHGWLEYRHGPANSCEMVNLEVDLDYRKQGIGRSMIDELCKDSLVKTLYGFTRWHNTGVHIFFLSMGFTTQLLRNFYGSGSDAVMVHKVVR